MRRLLDSYRLSPAGGGLLLVLTAAIVVLVVGPKHDETPAFVVIVVIVAMLAVQGVNVRGSSSALQRSLADRREEFHARARRPGDEGADETSQDELWARERERRSHE